MLLQLEVHKLLETAPPGVPKLNTVYQALYVLQIINDLDCVLDIQCAYVDLLLAQAAHVCLGCNSDSMTSSRSKQI